MTNWYTNHEMTAVLNCYSFGAELVPFESIELYGYPCIYCIGETVNGVKIGIESDVRIKATQSIIKELIRLDYVEVVDVNGADWYRLTSQGKEFRGEQYLYYQEADDHRNPRTEKNEFRDID